MRLLTRATPLALLVGVALIGCGKDSPPEGKNAAAPPKFEGAMPTAGAADVTIHVGMA